MEDPVNWKPGTADEVWKVMIAARDAMRAQDLIQGVSYILDNPGHCPIEESANVLRRFSGDQIADALLNYMAASRTAVARGIGKEGPV